MDENVSVSINPLAILALLLLGLVVWKLPEILGSIK